MNKVMMEVVSKDGLRTRAMKPVSERSALVLEKASKGRIRRIGDTPPVVQRRTRRRKDIEE